MTATADQTPRSSTGRLLAWWADEIATLVERRAAARVPWRVMLVREGSALQAYTRKRKTIVHAGTIDPASIDKAAGKLARRLAKISGGPAATVLRLAPLEIVHTQLAMPAGVRDVLGQVLANQVESHAPWPAAEAMFAHRSTPSAGDPARLDVDLWITGRQRVQSVIDALAQAGLKVGVVDFGDTAEAEPAVDFLANRRQDGPMRRQRLRRLIAVTLMFCGLATAGLTGWWLVKERERDALAQEIAVARRSATAAQLARGGTELERLRRQALVEKAQRASMSILVEALSAALPDQAWLERLEVRDGLLTIAGKATSAPALVAPLEASTHLTQVEFAAPTTRQPGDDKESFTLSARIVPRTRID